MASSLLMSSIRIVLVIYNSTRLLFNVSIQKGTCKSNDHINDESDDTLFAHECVVQVDIYFIPIELIQLKFDVFSYFTCIKQDSVKKMLLIIL